MFSSFVRWFTLVVLYKHERERDFLFEKKASESRKNLRKKIARLPPACLERKAPPSCFWTIRRTDFERKHGKIVPAVSQRPNFLLPFSNFRFPNRSFCFFLFLVAASSRSMLLQRLQRLHLFFFFGLHSQISNIIHHPRVVVNQKSQNERQRRRTKLSLSLSSQKRRCVRAFSSRVKSNDTPIYY